MNYFKKLLENLKQSFNLKSLAYVSLYDILAYSSLIIITFVWFNLLKTQTEKVKLVDMANILNQGIEQLESTLAVLKDFFFFIVVSITIAIILAILFYSIFKGLAYLNILYKRPSIKYLNKFFLLNLIWFFTYIVLVFLLNGIIKSRLSGIFIIILTIIYLYLSPILYIIFTKTDLIFCSIKNTLKKGVMKFHLLILPYIIITILYGIIALIPVILYKINWLKNINSKVWIFYNLFIIIIYFAWSKFYIRNNVEEFLE